MRCRWETGIGEEKAPEMQSETAGLSWRRNWRARRAWRERGGRGEEEPPSKGGNREAKEGKRRGRLEEAVMKEARKAWCAKDEGWGRPRPPRLGDN